MCEELARRFGKEKIHLENVVTAVDYCSEVVKVCAATAQGEAPEVTYKTKHLIFALPPTLLSECSSKAGDIAAIYTGRGVEEDRKGTP